MVSPITSKVVSTIGNPEALTPLLIKDTITSWAIVANSKKQGGEIESTDRFLDEFGTLAIWLGGIPFFKKVIDKTLYKYKKLNPNIDVRVLHNEAHKNFAQKHTTGSLKDSFDYALKNKDLSKRMFYTKFGLATGLTMLTYGALTKYRHYKTLKGAEKQAQQELYSEYANAQMSKNLIQENAKLKFSAIQKIENTKSDKVSFGMSGKGLQSFMFDPVRNTSIIDGSILGMRLGTSRKSDNSNKILTPERAEYLAKDMFIFFFYYAFGQMVQPWIDKGLSKIMKKPIGLDARVLDSKILNESLKNKKTLAANLNAFKKSAKNDAEILEFLQNNPDNIITQTAKISDTVKTIQPKTKNGNWFTNLFKSTDKIKASIDPTQYIDISKIKDIATHIEKMATETSKLDSANIDKFLKSSRNTKIGSILGGMGVCLFALGYVMPKLVFGTLRKKMNHGKTDFHVANHLKEECKHKMAMNMK